MGENVKHFTSEQKDENTYGWPWNEVVKKYLDRKLNQIKEPGDTFRADRERAEYLAGRNLVTIME